jgi:hydroxymethylbilane synthase
LALAQAAIVKAQLETASPGIAVEVIEIRTSGDRNLSPSLADAGGKGLFIKELETALSARTIDAAVHSMKDMPARVLPEFSIAAVLLRADPRDVLVSRDGRALSAMATGTRIGTSSARRKHLAMRFAPSAKVVPLRGNVDSRLEKLARGEFDAIILAASGLARLDKLDTVAHSILDPREFVPAAAQGAIAIEILASRRDAEFAHAVTMLNHAPSAYAVAAERAVLAALGASCATPIGVHASISTAGGKSMRLDSILFSADGSRSISQSTTVEVDFDLAISQAERAGADLANAMIARGAGAMIG